MCRVCLRVTLRSRYDDGLCLVQHASAYEKPWRRLSVKSGVWVGTRRKESPHAEVGAACE